MPMAGEGSRFLKEGWTTPKPLIELNGQPLFKHAISSVCADGIKMKYSFIVRHEHIEKYGIEGFNKKCRESVWKNEKAFKDFTVKMGQFIDVDNPYLTNPVLKAMIIHRINILLDKTYLYG